MSPPSPSSDRYQSLLEAGRAARAGHLRRSDQLSLQLKTEAEEADDKLFIFPSDRKDSKWTQEDLAFCVADDSDYLLGESFDDGLGVSNGRVHN